MKKNFTLLFLFTAIYSNAQVLCGTAVEGNSITLTAPPGNIFTTIEFASYGTPNGTCGSFTIGGCHASNSVAICTSVFVGFNSATISATNGVFGDPCGGTPKRLYIQARYSSTLPLNLISFTAKKLDDGKIRLDWASDNEVNTSFFIIEKSTDGTLFDQTGSVNAIGNGAHNYSFTDIVSKTGSVFYYRLKMVDKNGKYQYSNIVRVTFNRADIKLLAFPAIADKSITVITNRQQEAIITNYTGQIVKKVMLVNGNSTVNVAELNSGVYIIKTEEATVKFIKE